MGTVSPKIQVVKYGGDINLNCYSNEDIEWKFNKNRWHNSARSKKVVNISRATNSDAGMYTCVGSYRTISNRFIPFEDTAHVYVGRECVKLCCLFCMP